MRAARRTEAECGHATSVAVADDPAVDGLRVGHCDGQRPAVGNIDSGLARQPRREQIRLGDRNRTRVAGQAGQHDRRLGGTGSLTAGQPGQAGLLEMAPQRGVELVGHAAMTQACVERSAADVVDELRQFVHRAPMPLATTPRSTSFVPPRSVNNGE